MDREFKGVWIPRELWLNSNLKIMEKIFLAEIASLDGVDGCYASNSYFSDFFDLSRTRCSAIIKSLQDKGYISTKRFYEDGKKTLERRVIRVNECKIKSDFHNNARKLRKSVSAKNREKEKLEENQHIEQINMLEAEKEAEKKSVKKSEKESDKDSAKEYAEVERLAGETDKSDEHEVEEVSKLETKAKNQVNNLRENNKEKEVQSNVKRKINPEEEKLLKVTRRNEKVSNNPVYIDVIGYLNSVCQTKYKHTTTKNQRLINARVKEGYNLEDFKKVIDGKYSEWTDSNMKKYLRPETLFGTKFERYINEIQLGLVEGGQANGWKFRNSESNRENKEYSEATRTSKWSNGDNTNNRELTAEEWEWAERELF